MRPTSITSYYLKKVYSSEFDGSQGYTALSLLQIRIRFGVENSPCRSLRWACTAMLRCCNGSVSRHAYYSLVNCSSPALTGGWHVHIYCEVLQPSISIPFWTPSHYTCHLTQYYQFDFVSIPLRFLHIWSLAVAVSRHDGKERWVKAASSDTANRWFSWSPNMNGCILTDHHAWCTCYPNVHPLAATYSIAYWPN